MTAHYLVDQVSLIIVGGVSSYETEILLLDLHQLTYKEIAFKVSEFYLYTLLLFSLMNSFQKMLPCHLCLDTPLI